ncbi:hypothetical protein GCM10027422_47260 [Hymenobacter arcticus]
MKKSESQLQAALAESLQASLTGINEKHAKKLQKIVANAAKKIARKFAKLLAKEHKAGKATAAHTVAPALRKAARRVGKHAPRLSTHKKVGAVSR